MPASVAPENSEQLVLDGVVQNLVHPRQTIGTSEDIHVLNGGSPNLGPPLQQKVVQGGAESSTPSVQKVVQGDAKSSTLSTAQPIENNEVADSASRARASIGLDRIGLDSKTPEDLRLFDTGACGKGAARPPLRSALGGLPEGGADLPPQAPPGHGAPPLPAGEQTSSWSDPAAIMSRVWSASPADYSPEQIRQVSEILGHLGRKLGSDPRRDNPDAALCARFLAVADWPSLYSQVCERVLHNRIPPGNSDGWWLVVAIEQIHGIRPDQQRTHRTKLKEAKRNSVTKADSWDSEAAVRQLAFHKQWPR